MSRIEERLEALEAAARSTRLDEHRAAATVRFLTGTATIDDYEEFLPGLLDHTVRVILVEATRERLRRYPQYVPLVPRDKLLDKPHEERLAKLKEEVEWSYPPPIRSLSSTLPPYWLERLDGHTGPELAAVAAHCSYLLETETPPPEHLDYLATIDHGNDVAAKRCAHLYLAAISGGYDHYLRLNVEHWIAEWFLENEGEERRGDRFATRRGAGCQGSHFDCYHNRLPATCYDRATARGCHCHDRPNPSANTEDPDRTARELDAIRHTLGVRHHVPPCPKERTWTTYNAARHP